VKLASTPTGFGRIEGDAFVPMGDDIVRYLETGNAIDGPEVRLADVPLIAPVPRPAKVICVGLNYRDHAEETGQTIPDEPVLFSKFGNSVVGPGADVVVPRVVDQPDYEAELAVVIGRRASDVSSSDALAHVAGYTCANDVSARDLQFRSSQWLLGKAIDSFLPLGPWIVTPDEVGNPGSLSIRCRIDGDVVQDSCTDQMVFGVADLIAFISRTITLDPGDVIATGTPPGVGMARDPQRWLEDGERMTVEIEHIGALTNTVRRTGGGQG
jgi:2-keto-4-pentenoate hydratase/2-oxohepta-3-ene-1,7-dioic acid hydratase in catechol pathway